MERINQIPFSIKIFEEGDLSILKMEVLSSYLKEKTGIEVFLCGNIYKDLSENDIETLAKKFAKLRIKDPMKGNLSKTVFDGEVAYEKERIKEKMWKTFGILYEGILYQKLLSEFTLNRKAGEQDCIILITNQLIGSWDPDDLRYHLRTSIYGFPNIISINGLVLAPARPREFYLKRQMGIPLEILKEEYKGRFLDHNDLRMTEVLKGYLIQALLYQITGNPFCNDPDCRLFNSHWQEEMLNAQLNGNYEFCPEHEKFLKEIKDRKYA